MTALQRISPLDFDVAPDDEELPSYEPSSAPAYDDTLFDEPYITYTLRQYDRKIHMLIADGTTASSYRITMNGFRLFSKRPDMEILYTSPQHRQRNIATISFDRDGPLPWRPRAHFEYTEESGLTTPTTMESPDFTNWTFQCADQRYCWMVDFKPVSLVMVEIGSNVATARFTYSSKGCAAARGCDVGKLAIYRDHLTMQRQGNDMVVCSLLVALTHLKKMGRHYANSEDGQEVARAASLSRIQSATRRTSSGAMSVI